VFGPRSVEVTGGWRKLNNEFHNFYCSPNDDGIKKYVMGWTCSAHLEMRCVYKILIASLKGRNHSERLGANKG
jgi:hypothetical protein